jgi:hypothetical protein
MRFARCGSRMRFAGIADRSRRCRSIPAAWRDSEGAFLELATQSGAPLDRRTEKPPTRPRPDPDPIPNPRPCTHPPPILHPPSIPDPVPALDPRSPGPAPAPPVPLTRFAREPPPGRFGAARRPACAAHAGSRDPLEARPLETSPAEAHSLAPRRREIGAVCGAVRRRRVTPAGGAMGRLTRSVRGEAPLGRGAKPH